MLGRLQAEVLGVDIRQFAEQTFGCALAHHEHVRQPSVLDTCRCVCVCHLSLYIFLNCQERHRLPCGRVLAVFAVCSDGGEDMPASRISPLHDCAQILMHAELTL